MLDGSNKNECVSNKKEHIENMLVDSTAGIMVSWTENALPVVYKSERTEKAIRKIMLQTCANGWIESLDQNAFAMTKPSW